MDDSEDTLHQITKCYRQPIVSLLLAIQRHKASQQDFLSFLDQLECFYVDRFKRTLLRRRWINAWEETNFVALSYTWGPSPYEDRTFGGYSVENRCRSKYFPSQVRDCVFERITKYMRFMGVRLLWIDRHSIPQRTCKSPCEHQTCYKKKAGLQCMDWVYKQSKYPVALLGRPLNFRRELTLLDNILKGEFVYLSNRTNQFLLSQEFSRQQANVALRLLYRITSDLWWQRAWTFQENYKGGNDMVLLIRCPRSLERYKKRCVSFRDIPGELCVNSRLFSEEATKLCLAYTSSGHATQKDREIIESILSKAGRYGILLGESQAMSPAVIANVEERGVTDIWDRLAIVGNCCSYPERMNIMELRQNGHSLSLSMLAMYLLNGEILDNRPSAEDMDFDVTVSEFLKSHSFANMSSPLEHHSLTFNKGSRFFDVELRKSGILTSGHIWELGRVIQTDHFEMELPWVDMPRGGLSLSEQRYLTRLCQELEAFPESKSLARCICDYLDGDAVANPPFQFGENYMHTMMVEVANAMMERKALRLGRLPVLDDSTSIFIWEGDHKPGLIFTSSQPKAQGSDGYEAHNTDRHVSLEVELIPGTNQAEGGLPHLYTKRWVFGICFFVDCPRSNVLFPWPPVLRNIGL